MSDERPERGQHRPRPVPMPPHAGGCYRPMVTVPMSSVLKGVIISPKLLGFLMHYDTELGKCVPCRLPEECQCQEVKMSPKWIGYMEVALYPQWNRAVLILPKGAVQHCALLASEQARPLTGLWFTAGRMRPQRRAPIRVTVEEPTKSVTADWIGQPCDLAAVLQAAWDRLEDEPLSRLYRRSTN